MMVALIPAETGGKLAVHVQSVGDVDALRQTMQELRARPDGLRTAVDVLRQKLVFLNRDKCRVTPTHRELNEAWRALRLSDNRRE